MTETDQRMATTSNTGNAGAAWQVLADARLLVEPAHRRAVDKLPGPLRHIAGYHIGWWNIDGHPTVNSGKAVRPALVLAAAQAVGNDPASALSQAVAVELVHDFSLLHDDIIDGDLMRRHRPSAWSVFGVGATILTGDALQALAIDVLANGSGHRILGAAMLELCAGQAADITFGNQADVSVAECLSMAAAKTGALLGCACELGALAGGVDVGRAGLLAQFGRHLGLAFQLIDDLLGIWGDPTITGKPVFSDLSGRKKSLPVTAALTSGTVAGNRLVSLYDRDHDGEHENLAILAGLVEAAGGRDWAQAEADRQVSLGLACLSEAVPDQTRRADLLALAGLIIRRES